MEKGENGKVRCDVRLAPCKWSTTAWQLRSEKPAAASLLLAQLRDPPEFAVDSLASLVRHPAGILGSSALLFSLACAFGGGQTSPSLTADESFAGPFCDLVLIGSGLELRAPTGSFADAYWAVMPGHLTESAHHRSVETRAQCVLLARETTDREGQLSLGDTIPHGEGTVW
jgi:hypothetical protein